MVEETRGSCSGHDDDVAGLALGILTGRDRARALAHIEDCQWCNNELFSLAVVADSLLDLAPCPEPPVGFEAGLLARLRTGERGVPRGRRRRKA
jgi:hypothetical protein